MGRGLSHQAQGTRRHGTSLATTSQPEGQPTYYRVDQDVKADAAAELVIVRPCCCCHQLELPREALLEISVLIMSR